MQLKDPWSKGYHFVSVYPLLGQTAGTSLLFALKSVGQPTVLGNHQVVIQLQNGFEIYQPLIATHSSVFLLFLRVETCSSKIL